MGDEQQQTKGYFTLNSCDFGTFKTLIARTTKQSDVPLASGLKHNIPHYDMADLRPMFGDRTKRRALMSEWADVMMHGAGAIALQGAYADTSVLDEATAIYEQIIAEEKAASGGGADHFAAAGSNDRVWNSLQKLCLRAPDVFARYFANTSLAAASEAWLGPNYQMTAQVNLVHPGGAAQQAHRDYHLGFQTADASAAYPAHVHDLSPVLTLQGAVAHCDMPVESGPTKLLPFSQAYRAGYAAWRHDDFRTVFEENYVQLPLKKGDALFFNPALFHAAGANSTTDIHRMANLLQVSSAFGRALENIDRPAMCNALYPVTAVAKKTLSALELDALLGATAEGYPFPTNLDTDPPIGGLAPESQKAFFARALSEGMSAATFAAHLDEMATKQRP
ncbi:MAG: ectoine hydroxylase-related dioxygenase (phytanoyl-CoA dioxygenase family) [Yoonia sp.]|jgi:ectoine hydroxylase-related dioxygenase (phytanoyl-CoA dioxygenase family)